MDVELVNDGPVTIVLESVGRASSLSPAHSADTVGRASSLSPAQPISPETNNTLVLQPFDPSASIGNSSRHMPHWTQPGCTYFVTFRLADSVPAEKLQQWNRLSDPNQVREEVQKWLDKGTGTCWLRRPEIANVVANSLRHFHGERYDLRLFVVMPNHIHVLVTPLPGHELSEILHSWKSYTANQINRLLGQSGPVWQHESFDHIVRDEQALLQFEGYIRDNPKSACLKEGEYVLGP
jgi:REP element-mobilizing transposase RayT